MKTDDSYIIAPTSADARREGVGSEDGTETGVESADGKFEDSRAGVVWRDPIRLGEAVREGVQDREPCGFDALDILLKSKPAKLCRRPAKMLGFSSPFISPECEARGSSVLVPTSEGAGRRQEEERAERGKSISHQGIYT